jgi:hypothetical protein
MASSRSIASASNRLVAWLAAAAVAVAVLVVAPGMADARKKVAVLKFTGPKAAKFQKDVEKAVKKGNTVVSDGKYQAAAKKAKAKKVTEKNVAKVAKKLGLDGVVTGSVKKKGKRYTVSMSLRGKDGSVVTTVKVTAKAAKFGAAEQRTLRNELIAAIDDLPDDDDGGSDSGGFAASSGDSDSSDSDSSDSDTASSDTGSSDSDSGSASSDDQVASSDDGGSADDENPIGGGGGGASDSDGEIEKGAGEGSGESLTDEDSADMAARGRAVDIAGGLSFIGRNLSFAVADGLEDTPQGYQGSLVAGAYITAEVYPLAFGKSKGAMRNIGMSFALDQVIKIESRLNYTDAGGEEVEATLPTSVQRYGIGLIYRMLLGAKVTGPTVKVSVRFNKSKFDIDKSDVPAEVVDIPNTDYTYVDPGVALRYPFSPKLAVEAGGRFLALLSTGEINNADQYGQATALGFDLDAAVDYKVTPQIFVRGGGRYQTINLSFDGTGDLSNNRDGDPTTQDVDSATDSSYGGYVQAGYLF